MARRYSVKEIFCSPQGEGLRAGTLNVFVRFAGCNLQCTIAKHGFDCDTDFSGGESMSGFEILKTAAGLMPNGPRSVVFTGGEPMQQVTIELLSLFRGSGWYTAIETNGTLEISDRHRALLCWVCCSPKPGEEYNLENVVDEVKFVLQWGQVPEVPDGLIADHLLVSPAFRVFGDDEEDELDPDAVDWCLGFIATNPAYRLSLQTHKWIGVK